MADEAEPRAAETAARHGVHAERGGGGGRHDDAHIADEVGGEHLVQLERAEEAHREPHDERQVRHRGRHPERERGAEGQRRQVVGELHERHEHGAAHAGHDGVVQIVADKLGKHDCLRRQQHDEEQRDGAAEDMDALVGRLQQVAQRRESQGDARCGNRYLLDDVAHSRMPFYAVPGFAQTHSGMLPSKRKIIYRYVLITIYNRLSFARRLCIVKGQVMRTVVRPTIPFPS